MNFTAALRTCNCQGSLASLLRLHYTAASFQSAHVNVCISVPKFYIKVHKARIEQKRNVVVVVIFVVVVVAIFAMAGTMS